MKERGTMPYELQTLTLSIVQILATAAFVASCAFLIVFLATDDDDEHGR